jgi:hypothetical protein
LNQANITYLKIDGRLKVVSASFQDSQDRSYSLLGDMIGQDYDNEDEIVMAIQECANQSWDAPDQQIEVRFTNPPKYHVTNTQPNLHKSKPTINSDVLIKLM